MALTEERLGELRSEELRELSLDRAPATRAPSASRVRLWAVARGRLHWGVLLAWVGFLPLAYAIEPAPAASGPLPAWAVVLGYSTTIALAVAGAGLIRRQRMGMVGSAAAAGLFLFATVMCPVSGHHNSVGAWWFAQMAGFVALGGLSLVGLRRSRTQG